MTDKIDDQIVNVKKDGTSTSDAVAKLTNTLVADSDVLANFGRRLEAFITGRRSAHIESLPQTVKRRLKALKKIQYVTFLIESTFMEEVHKLEVKYAELFKPFFDRRSEIVNGNREPTDSECEFGDEEEEDEDEESTGEKVAAHGEPDVPDKMEGENCNTKLEEEVKGITWFWLTVLQNVPSCDERIGQHDWPALERLKDVRVLYSKEEESDRYFELQFEFDENDFFENTVLTKRYFLKMTPDMSYPLFYDGPEIVKSDGCAIKWKEGRNLTCKEEVVKEGVLFPCNKEKEFSSFFDFFSVLPDKNEKGLSEKEKVKREKVELLDFELGQLLQVSVIPKAVLYYTGDALTDDDEDEGEYDDDDDDDDGIDGEVDESDDGSDSGEKNPSFNTYKAPPQTECKQQ